MSKIEWTNKTWNPITGCTKISEGCKNCYAEKMAKRLKGRFGYPVEDPFSLKIHRLKFVEPLYWTKPRMVFVCSMSDLFHEDVPFKIIDFLINVMRKAGQHTFQVLTKRPERMLEFYTWKQTHIKHFDWKFPKNVWLGVTAENQEQANKRIPILLQIPAAVRFVSCEPLLGPISMKDYLSPPMGECPKGEGGKYPLEGSTAKPGGISWAICGGESGHNARPMHPDWARSLRDQCQAAGVPFFFKQWGEWLSFNYISDNFKEIVKNHPKAKLIDKYTFEDGFKMMKIGKKAAGRLLDGKEWNEMPNQQPVSSNQ